MEATANNVDGEISSTLLSIDVNKFSAVSFKPVEISAKRSVFAVQSTTILSTPLFDLKSFMSLLICSNASFLLAHLTTLSARSDCAQ